MLIKTFYEDPGKIETIVNSWLKNTENIEPINVSVSSCYSKNLGYTKILATVVYNIKEN